VRLGEPQPAEIDRHHRWQYGEIVLFVPKSLLIPNPFSIVIASFLFYRRLAIEGWKLF